MKQSTGTARRVLLAVLMAAGLMLVGAAPVAAQEFVSDSSEVDSLPEQTDVLGANAEQGTAVDPNSAASPDSLAFTGGDIAGLVLLGTGLIVVGTIVVMRRRARVEVSTT